MIAPAGEGAAPGFPRALVVPGPVARQLRKLPGPAGVDVLAALEAYAATGAGNVTRLVDVRPPTYRLRVGEYRAVFRLTGGGATGAAAAVTVEWAGHRRDAY